MSRIPATPMRGIAENELLWPPDKHWLNVRFLNGSWFERDIVRRTVKKHLNSVPMGIRFYFYQENESGMADIRVKFSNDSYSCVGTEARWCPDSEPTMELDLEARAYLKDEERYANIRRIILHEFGHALGLHHEHQHPECEIPWDFSVAGKLNGWTRRMVWENYARLEPEGNVLEPYDAESIMHYPVREGEARDGMVTTSENTVLSDGDKKMLTIIYPPREDGWFKPEGDNSESHQKSKWGSVNSGGREASGSWEGVGFLIFLYVFVRFLLWLSCVVVALD